MDSLEADKERIVGIFERAAPTYDRVGPSFFAEFGRRLVDHAGIPSGASVLDVATGTGAALFPAAKRVGSEGTVIGIDLAQAMVDSTAAEIKRRRVVNAEVRYMDAERLTFDDDSHDVVLCGLSLFLFPRLDRVLAEFLRVLRPGGTVAVTTFMAVDEPTKRLNNLLDAYGVNFKLMLHPLRASAELKDVLSKAGFESIKFAAEEVDFVYENEEQWWAMNWSIGVRGALESLDEAAQARLKADACRMMQEFTDEAGLHHPRRVRYTTAISPLR